MGPIFYQKCGGYLPPWVLGIDHKNLESSGRKKRPRNSQGKSTEITFSVHRLGWWDRAGGKSRNKSTNFWIETNRSQKVGWQLVAKQK